jgi:hypothetical protein
MTVNMKLSIYFDWLFSAEAATSNISSLLPRTSCALVSYFLFFERRPAIKSMHLCPKSERSWGRSSGDASSLMLLASFLHLSWTTVIIWLPRHQGGGGCSSFSVYVLEVFKNIKSLFDLFQFASVSMSAYRERRGRSTFTSSQEGPLQQ